MTPVDPLASGAYRDHLLGFDAYVKKQPLKYEALIEPIIVRVQVMGKGLVDVRICAGLFAGRQPA